MNNTKSPKNVSLKNQLELWLFCALIGAVAGALVWILLKIMAVGTEFLWKWFPGKTSVPYYTILICVAGATIIGIFRKIFGDYPEDLETVMEKVRAEKRYEYKNMLVMMVAALLPLLIGSSVGPEAGLTGIIVGLCYWAGDNLKFAKQNTRNYSQIGAAVSMSVLFHAPLFGIFEVEENSEEDLAALTKGSKLFIYGIALAAGTGIYAGLSALLVQGFPDFHPLIWWKSRKRLSAYDSVYFVRSYPGILLSGNTQTDRKYFQQIPGSCQRNFCRFMSWNHRFILTCTYVFRRRADGNTYENLYLLSAAGTYWHCIF